jgi:L-fuconate dehydratase
LTALAQAPSLIGSMTTIAKVTASDRRYRLEHGAGSDAIHADPTYSYAVAELGTDGKHTGIGLAFTVGGGNELVCQAITALAQPLVGLEIEAAMADGGALFRRIADHHQLRWLGPHKGVVHLALSAIVNACFDLWAKARGVPLWKLLIDLKPEALVDTLDLSYLEDVLTREEALALLAREAKGRGEREKVLKDGYPGYDTSVGWFNYDDERIRENARRSLAEGFGALKLKVGSADSARDLRRAAIVREVIGPDRLLMVDANQQWTLPKALTVCRELAKLDPYWIEEPTHPDDVAAHKTIADAIAPVKVAMGEHVPNRVLFKNYLLARAAHFIQVDCVRVAGISEFVAVSLMARKFGLPVVPHVGDMGQIHQHLVLFNHVSLGHPRLFLEYIPHLRQHFVHPARVEGGFYRTPQEPGSSSDLKAASSAGAK